MNRQEGFSLIEVLIVVAIIGIIAAIAVPNLAAAQRSAREAGAIQNIRTLISAEALYNSSSSGQSYTNLSDLIARKLVDSAFTGQRSGYLFTVTVNAIGDGYIAQATPQISTGMRYFYGVEDGRVLQNTVDNFATATQIK